MEAQNFKSKRYQLRREQVYVRGCCPSPGRMAEFFGSRQYGTFVLPA